MDLIVVDSSSDDEKGDGKPYAVGPVGSKKAGSKVIGGGKGKAASAKKKEEKISVSEESIRSYRHMLKTSATNLRSIVSKGMLLYKPETIVATKNKMQQIGTPLLHTCIENVVGLERVEHECLKDSVFRTGVQTMERVSSSMVGLFCAGIQIDIFGCEKVGITKYIHQVMTYFESARYGNDDGVVHAEVDVAVMQTVAESASDEEVESFRGGFKNIFVRNNPYVMNEKDSRLEWKAFVVFLSLSCIDLYNKYGDEAIDIVPFLKVCLNSLYFKSSTQALGLIYFGFARNAVVAELSPCYKSVANERTFYYDFLTSIMRNTNTAGARCLQYLSVIIFFEMIALTVVKKEAIINDRLKLLMDHTNSKRSEFPMNIIFYHYYKHVFGAFVPFFKAKENVLQGFQRTFGYTLLAKWLVLFCKKEFTVYSDGRKAKKESIDAPLRKKVKMSQDVQEIKQRKNAKPAEDPTKTESTNKVLTYEVLEVKLHEAWSKFDRTNRELQQKYSKQDKQELSSLKNQLQLFIGQAAKDKESMMARIILLEEQLQQAIGRGHPTIHESAVKEVFVNIRKPPPLVQPPTKPPAEKTPRIFSKPHNLETKSSEDLPLTPEQILEAFSASNFTENFSFDKPGDDDSGNDNKSDHESGSNNKSEDDSSSKSKSENGSSDEKEEEGNSNKEDDESEDEDYTEDHCNHEKDSSDDHILNADSNDTDGGKLSKSDVTP